VTTLHQQLMGRSLRMQSGEWSQRTWLCARALPCYSQAKAAQYDHGV